MMIAVWLVVWLARNGHDLLVAEIVMASATVSAAAVEMVLARVYPKAVALDLPLLVSSAVVGVVIALGSTAYAVWSAVSAHWSAARLALPLTAALVIVAVWSIVPVRRAERTGSPGRGGREGIWWWW